MGLVRRGDSANVTFAHPASAQAPMLRGILNPTTDADRLMPPTRGLLAQASGVSAEPAPSQMARDDEPLPSELTGRRQGWFAPYRRYPVFSRSWVRGRLWRVGALVLLFCAFGTASVALTGAPVAAFGGMGLLSLQLLLPVLLGPWVAMRIRRAGWPEVKEQRALWAWIAVLVLSLAALAEWGSEPAKQWLAESMGEVDASGKRKKVVMTVGVMLNSPATRGELPANAAGAGTAASAASAASAAAPRPVTEEPGPPSAYQRIVNQAVLGFVVFGLGGGFAVRALKREYADLASLAREQEHQREQAQRREAETKLSVLAAQVEPHFLFNTLAGVRSAIHSDPARASLMVDQLVSYLRHSIPRLRSGGQSTESSLGEQMEVLRAYLGLMTSRMPRLSVDFEVPPDLLSARCPPWMLISLAENAVRHGVEPKRGPAHIEVSAASVAEPQAGDAAEPAQQLLITVKDDGVGFDAPGAQAGSGIGLANIRERLAQMYGPKAALELRAVPEGGVAASLRLPLEWTAVT